MKFMIQSIEAKVEPLPSGNKRATYVFNFLQIGVAFDFGILSSPGIKIILEENDPRVKEWQSAFYEKRYFELSINPV